jgi:hypothetical protein
LKNGKDNLPDGSYFVSFSSPVSKIPEANDIRLVRPYFI